jgi:hypothetical protein
MTELELYKFINDNTIEWHRRDNEGEEDIIIFPYIFQIEEFQKLLSNHHYDDGGLICRMMNGYFAFWMKDICEYYGIEINNVFVGEDSEH